jgi:hypothetical protein
MMTERSQFAQSIRITGADLAIRITDAILLFALSGQVIESLYA